MYRLPLALPQIEVGNLNRMAAIDQRLSGLPGVFVTASGFRGVGLPDVIDNAHAVAARIASYIGITGDTN